MRLFSPFFPSGVVTRELPAAGWSGRAVGRGYRDGEEQRERETSGKGVQLQRQREHLTHFHPFWFLDQNRSS